MYKLLTQNNKIYLIDSTVTKDGNLGIEFVSRNCTGAKMFRPVDIALTKEVYVISVLRSGDIGLSVGFQHLDRFEEVHFADKGTLYNSVVIKTSTKFIGSVEEILNNKGKVEDISFIQTLLVLNKTVDLKEIQSWVLGGISNGFKEHN